MPPTAAAHRAHGLEWFPAGSGQPLPYLSSSTRSPHATGPKHRPLVVILPWMWAARAAVARHVALYHSLGCDVAVFHGWPPLSVWLPPLARRNAGTLLTALATHLREQGPRDVVLVCFSGAAKGVLCPLLERLVPGAIAAAAADAAGGATESVPAAATAAPPPPARNHLRFLLSFIPGASVATQQQEQQQQSRLPKRPPLPPPAPQPDPAAELLLPYLRGVLFDSGPVDFDSSVGVRLFATARQPALRALQAAAGAAAAGALDFCLYEAFESQRRAMWVGLRCGLATAGLPVAFLYSWSGDALADPQPIHALAVALRGEAAPTVAAAAAEPATVAGGKAVAPVAGPMSATAVSGADSTELAAAGAGTWLCCTAGAVPTGSGGGGGDVPAASSSTSSSSENGGGTPAAGDPGLRRQSFPAGISAAVAAAPPHAPAAAASCGGVGSPHAAGPSAAVAAVRVWEQGWAHSPHVAHLREHTEQYRRVVSAFLEGCLGPGGGRRGRGGVGTAAAAAASTAGES